MHARPPGPSHMTAGYVTGGADTRALAPELRRTTWREHVTDNHGHLDVDFGAAPAFTGGTRVQRCGNVQLVEFRSEAVRYRRSAAAVDQDGDDSLRVVLPLHGSLQISAAGVRRDLTPGLAAAMSMQRGFRLEQGSTAHALILSLPRSWWQESVEQPVVWDLAKGAGAVFAVMLRQIADQRDDLDAASFLRACEAAALVLPPDTLVDLHTQALALVREHSDSASFGPQELSLLLGRSLRSLQQSLHAIGTSPAEMIRTQRLQRAATRLHDPHWRASTISHLAHRSGFGSLTAFNTAFRAHTGSSPSEFRRRAPA